MNLLLTIAIIAGMTAFKLEPAAVFMVGVVIALQVNYPKLEMQAARINAHAQAALMMAGILFAAGAFTGIMKDSGMLDAMAKSAVNLAPPGAGHHLPFVMGLISMPLSGSIRSRFCSIFGGVAGAGSRRRRSSVSRRCRWRKLQWSECIRRDFR